MPCPARHDEFNLKYQSFIHLHVEQFYIRLKLETNEIIDLPCKDVSDYARKAAMVEEQFPYLDWHEIRIPGGTK